MKTGSTIILILYAAALSIWSGNISEAAGGLWFIGVAPVFGWLYSIIDSNLWESNFALLSALWLISVIIVTALPNREPKQID